MKQFIERCLLTVLGWVAVRPPEFTDLQRENERLQKENVKLEEENTRLRFQVGDLLTERHTHRSLSSQNEYMRKQFCALQEHITKLIEATYAADGDNTVTGTGVAPVNLHLPGKTS